MHEQELLYLKRRDRFFKKMRTNMHIHQLHRNIHPDSRTVDKVYMYEESNADNKIVKRNFHGFVTPVPFFFLTFQCITKHYS